VSDPYESRTEVADDVPAEGDPGSAEANPDSGGGDSGGGGD
jgi:hypothetical protein